MHAIGEAARLPWRGIRQCRFHVDVLVLGRAVRCEERAGQVDDRVAVPHHAHALFLGHLRDRSRLEVLLAGIAEKLFHVIGCNSDSHAFLRFRDRQLRAVKAFVLLRHLVEVHIQAVRKLSDSHGHAAGAEIIAALDKARRIAAAEQALQLAFDGRIALLHFSAVLLQGFDVVRLGGARGTADAVATGATTQQDDHVAGLRLLAAHMVGRCGAHDGAHLHALGNIAGMVDFVDLAGRQANLVAVGAVACGCLRHDLALGQLALQRLRDRRARVGSAGHAHGLVHVAASRQRVADAAADAGCGTTEGFDLGGVVVRFVLEQEQPILLFAIHIHLHLDGAGVDFLGFVKVLQNPLGLEVLGADRANVHEAHRLAVAAELMADLQVFVERLLHHGVIDCHIGETRAERRVAAVVRPIRVDDLDFGNRGVAVLSIGEILAAELCICQIHRQATVVDELLQLVVRVVAEAVDDLDWLRLGHGHAKRRAGVKTRLACLHRVDDVLLDGGDVRVAQVSGEHIHDGGTHGGAIALADELDAFAGGVGTLVELAGQEFGGEHHVILAHGGHRFGGVIGLRLAEHGGDARMEQVLRDSFHIVTVDHPQILQAVDAQDRAQFIGELLSLDIEAVLLFHIDAKNHGGVLSVTVWLLRLFCCCVCCVRGYCLLTGTSVVHTDVSHSRNPPHGSR